MNLPLQIYLVGIEAHCQLDFLEQTSNQLEPQAPPLHKPSMSQLKAPSFWGKNGSLSWPWKPPTCMPSYVHPNNLYIG
jgi:hypothetical protein